MVVFALASEGSLVMGYGPQERFRRPVSASRKPHLGAHLLAVSALPSGTLLCVER